jgi:hypothetical protein
VSRVLELGFRVQSLGYSGVYYLGFGVQGSWF